MRCPACAHDNEEHARFCVACGAGLVSRCPACEANNPPGSRYCGHCGTALAGASSRAATHADAPFARPDAAERRQLTIMFADLVGFTEMTARLDPEDVRDLVLRYQNCASNEIQRYDGFVAKLLGDGIMAYFGFPQAHENDAERAVLSGLGIADAVRALEIRSGSGEPIDVAVRVGIATGTVVVGDMVGDGVSERWAVVGDAPNFAARLQAIAPPNGVVLGAATRQLAGGAFDYRDLGEHALKGIAQPQRVWQVMARRATRTRFDAVHERAATALVGRDRELDVLLAAWQRAVAGDGRAIVVRGEPGIGKSRIVQDFCDRLRGVGYQRLDFQCSPYHAASALYPVIPQVEQAAGIATGDDDARKLAKLEAWLPTTGPDALAALPVVAALLGLRAPGGDKIEPRVQRERTLSFLQDFVRSFTFAQPLLLVIEDAHWIDPTTLEWLQRIAAEAPALRLLAIVTARPEFEAAWQADARVEEVAIRRLTEDQVKSVVAGVCAGSELPSGLVQQIVAKADGVPLFVEELTKAVLETVVPAQGAPREGASVESLPIPATLHDSLMARLDRLPQEKSVAQVAAVIGRRFSYDLLAAVAGVDPDRLDRSLLRLQDAELIFPRAHGGSRGFEFKHALIQDAAYQSLLRSTRRAHHERIARTLQERFPVIAAVEPELVAHHYTEAGNVEQAVGGWMRAGTRAVEVSAYVEALRHFDRALAMLPRVANDRTRTELELGVELARGNALTAVQGYGSPAVAHAYSRARALAEQAGTEPQKFAAAFGLWRIAVTEPDFGNAQTFATELQSRADALGAPELVMTARGTAGLTTFFLGRLAHAQEHFARVAELYSPAAGRAIAVRAGQDPGLTCLVWSALASWLQARGDEARERYVLALERSRAIGHAFTLAYTLRVGCLLDHAMGDFDALLAHADELSDLATAENFVQMQASARILLGVWTAETRGASRALGDIEQGIADYRNASGLTLPWALGMLGRAYARSGDPDRADAALDESLALAHATQERWYEAELLRLGGEWAAAAGKTGAAEAIARLERSAAVAREQGALWLLRRAEATLAAVRGHASASA